MEESQDFKPDRGNPAVRHYRGASENVTLVEMCSHLATERAGMGTLHLTVGASELYPNLNGNGELTDRPDLRSSGASPYSRSRNEIMYTNRGGFGSPLVRSVRRACHRSKHLLEVLFERASRCYEWPVLTHDVLVESFEQRDALGS